MPKEKYEQFSLFEGFGICEDLENAEISPEIPQEQDDDKWVYKVYAPDGVLRLQATKDARYDRELEKYLLENGFTITFCGKKLSKRGV